MVGLLSDALGGPLLNLGAGLLSQAGPSFQPRNIGTGLLTGLRAASQAQQAALANQLVRQRLATQQRQEQARQRFAGLLLPTEGAGRVGPTPAAAGRLAAGAQVGAALGGDERSQMLGLLAQTAPDAVAEGLLGQFFPAQRAEPADIRSLRAIGIDPTSDEGRRIIIDRLTQEGGSLEELDGILKALNIQKIREELSQGSREDLQDRRRSEVALLNTVNAVAEMAELNDRLEGTLGETGIPFAGARRAGLAGGGALGRLTGLGGADLTALAAGLDRFDKLATVEVIRAAEEARIRGSLTNQQLQAFQAAKPGTGVTPEANRQILADMLELSLSAADARDIVVRDRDQKERLIRRLRGADSTVNEQPRQRPAPPSGTVSSMSLRELRALAEDSTRLQGLSDEDLDMLERRLRRGR